MLFNYLLLSVFFFSSSTQVHLPLLYLCYRLLCTKKTAGHTPGVQYFFLMFLCVLTPLDYMCIIYTDFYLFI